MRAVGVREFGGPEALQVEEVPEVHAGPGEVRLAVRAAAVSPTDTGARSGLYARLQGPPPDWPVVPGMDVAGVVDEVGADGDGRLAVGDEVMAIVLPAGSHGGYREQLVLPAASVVPVPAGADLDAASTLSMNGLTARLALDEMALEPGAVVAVTGAAGAFGGYLVQLAKVDRLTVVADASEADTALVRSLGADVVLPRGDGFVEAVRARYPDGVDGLADGALLNAKALPAVRDGGVVTTVRGYTGEDAPEELARGLRVVPVRVRSYGHNTAALDRLRAQVEAGQVTLRVAEVLPAERAAEAHRRLEAGGVRGRLVLSFAR